jgi:ribosome biogenesis GTPase
VEVLAARLQPGRTAALIGSSGAGKSTLLNRLYGREIQRVQQVREHDSRGRHTTTHRQLIRTPAGWLLLDLPGLRELQLWARGDHLGRVFHDIASLAARCRFRDCTHQGEPGCAVRQAVDDGELEPGRLDSHVKLSRELAYLERKQDQRAALQEKRRWKQIHRAMRKAPGRR